MKSLTVFLFLCATINVVGQTISSRSTEAVLDFGTGSKNPDGSLAAIVWLLPENEIMFVKESRLTIHFKVNSKQPIKRVQLLMKDHTSGATISQTSVSVSDDKLNVNFEKPIVLPDGVNDLEVTVENENGYRSVARRQVHVGATVMADAAKLNRLLGPGFTSVPMSPLTRVSSLV